MSFASFVTYATVQTQSVQPQAMAEEVSEVLPNNDPSELYPQVASVNTTLDSLPEPVASIPNEFFQAQSSDITPTAQPVTEQVQEPVITPVIVVPEQKKEELRSVEKYSESYHYEDDDDEDERDDD